MSIGGRIILVAAACLGLAASSALAVIRFDNSYYSPRNRERPVRSSTALIILHTTEAPAKSALRKLSDLGECNYCIDESGIVYRIIDHRRVAYHAGRSMWNGRSNVDEFSVGIEMCGYHNKPLTREQYRALAELIGELKYIYKVQDYNVLAHSHVAYGAPNKWQPRSHRGRKRCGMMFALPSVRSILNLKSRPLVDPDVKARRLVVGDAYLAKVLYGPVKQSQAVVTLKADESNVIGKDRSAWDIARDAYDDADTLYIFPDGKQKRGNQLANFKLLPSGTKVIVNTPADNHPEKVRVVGDNGKPQDIAGAEALDVSTLYVFPDGRYYRGSQLGSKGVLNVPYGTKVLVGYAIGGPVSSSRPASAICGSRWRSADTYYLISGVLVAGTRVDDSKIPAGTMVFFKN